MASSETDRLVENALSGGSAKLVSEADLLALYHQAAERNLMIIRVEPFRLEGEWQMPDVHLTVLASV